MIMALVESTEKVAHILSVDAGRVGHEKCLNNTNILKGIENNEKGKNDHSHY